MTTKLNFGDVERIALAYCRHEQITDEVIDNMAEVLPGMTIRGQRMPIAITFILAARVVNLVREKEQIKVLAAKAVQAGELRVAELEEAVLDLEANKDCLDILEHNLEHVDTRADKAAARVVDLEADNGRLNETLTAIRKGEEAPVYCGWCGVKLEGGLDPEHYLDCAKSPFVELVRERDDLYDVVRMSEDAGVEEGLFDEDERRTGPSGWDTANEARWLAKDQSEKGA